MSGSFKVKYFRVIEKPIKDFMSLCSNVGPSSKGSENICFRKH